MRGFPRAAVTVRRDPHPGPPCGGLMEKKMLTPVGCAGVYHDRSVVAPNARTEVAKEDGRCSKG